MIIKKKIQGKIIVLKYNKVKEYPNKYIVYDVYKILNETKSIFLYKTCLTSLQIKELKEQKFIINSEEIFGLCT